jgi:hypothetical protein
MFRIAQGEVYGTIYGRDFVRDCGQLPGGFASQCSMNGVQIRSRVSDGRNGAQVSLARHTSH